MQIKTILSIFTSIFILYGCASSPILSTSQRTAYLQSFVGKTSTQIQAHLDLNSLGYQNVSAPVLENNSLTYTALRPISIPIPIAQNPITSADGGTPVSIPTQGYNTELKCQIRFQLKHDIAQSVQLSGRTC